MTGPAGRREVRLARDHGEATEQARPAAALRELVRQEDRDPADPEGGAAAPPSAHRLTAEGCTACSTCVRACPTAALTLEPSPDGSDVTLTLLPDACVGCRQCLALCPVDALTDHGQLGWAGLLAQPSVAALETVEVKECARCRAPFSGEVDLCQVARRSAVRQDFATRVCRR